MFLRFRYARYRQQHPVASAGPAFLKFPSIHAAWSALGRVIQPNLLLIQSSDYDEMQVGVGLNLQGDDQNPTFGNLAGHIA